MTGCSCDICEKEVFDYPFHRVCPRCDEGLRKDTRKNCPVCGRKVISEGVCLSCKASRPIFTRGISAFAYEGTAASAVNRFKHGKEFLSYFLAERLYRTFLQELEEDIDKENAVVVCVPMTKEGKERRGYNQAEELAARFSEYSGIPFLQTALVKRRETDLQKEKSGKEREENVRGAYFVHERKNCKDKIVLLVDDTMTTGATGNEISSILFAAGAKKVYFLTATAAVERK